MMGAKLGVPGFSGLARRHGGNHWSACHQSVSGIEVYAVLNGSRTFLLACTQPSTVMLVIIFRLHLRHSILPFHPLILSRPGFPYFLIQSPLLVDCCRDSLPSYPVVFPVRRPLLALASYAPDALGP